MKTGITTELEIQYNVSKLGAIVSIPYGDCARYDHIWDINGKLLKVQIKTSQPLNDDSGFKFPGKIIQVNMMRAKLMELLQYMMESVTLYQSLNVLMKQN